ncbi:MAG: TPM domain-containing protein [Leptospiraceae bacterium]
MGHYSEREKPYIVRGIYSSFAFFLLLSALSLPSSLQAQEVPLPEMEARVLDRAGMLSPADAQALTQKLKSLEDRQGSQVAIVILPTIGDVPIEDFSIRLVEKWKLGREGVDDGVLILVAQNERKMRIEVGYGLEGVIPDAKANRIIDQIMTPNFRAGNYYEGLDKATDAIIALIDGEELPSLEDVPLQNQEGEGIESFDTSGFGQFFFIAVLVGALILRVIYNGFLAVSIMAPVGILLGWLLIGFSVTMIFSALFAAFIGAFGRGGGVGSGGFASSGGGFSSGGGGFSGGFSGGGGSFGGGGASGSW